MRQGHFDTHLVGFEVGLRVGRGVGSTVNAFDIAFKVFAMHFLVSIHGKLHYKKVETRGEKKRIA